MEKTTPAMLLALVAACAAEGPEVGTRQQDERIEVHGCQPGFDLIDEGGGIWTCVGDPGWLPGGHPDESPPRGGERVPGPGPGGGGGGGADPYPIPSPKDCTQELTHETCVQCCDWNVDKVWGERCNRIPKKNKHERKLCWEDAERRRSDCQLECPRPGPIVTIEGPQ